MHEDHRKRVRERFLTEGLDNFAPHNVLEFLLFYSIPRRDTNEIAHRLIEKFGSLGAVFDADIEELKAVEDIGENSAVLLKLIPQLSRRYMVDKLPQDGVFNSVNKVGNYFIAKYIGHTVESVYLMLLDNSYRVLNCDIIFTGSVNSAKITSRMIIERALRYRATIAVLAHNHPGGVAIPSDADISTTRNLYEALSIVDVCLLEHLVIAGDKFSTIMAGPLSGLNQAIGKDELHRFYTE